jgi:acetoin utilization deacetylase AcuC-like enzyme
MTLLYTDPLFLQHKTGAHPERPARLRAVTARLEHEHLPARCHPGSYQPLTVEAVEKVHAPHVVRSVGIMVEQGGGRLDPDTVVSPASFQVALAAAGACVSAVDAVLRGDDNNALCLVRPPGHHATPTRSMGFCLFNNIALAANHALTAHALDRVLIVDWDVHHGNGTQDVFYADPRVLFFSIHRFGYGFYPGTGDADETGEGPGLGYTLNVPVRYPTAQPDEQVRRDYQAAFRHALEKAAHKIKPQLVLISAGFDAHALDPIGSLGLEVEDFVGLTRQVLDVARSHCQGRVVSCLEGGYNLDVLAESVQAHLEELLAVAS